MKEAMRKIHLYSALGITAFLAMYFVTGFVMVKHDWFPNNDPDKRTRMIQVQIPGELDVDQAGAWLADRFNLRGKPQPPRTFDDGRVRYNFYRPGIGIAAHLDSDRRRVVIETTDRGFHGMMVGYHRMHGYDTNLFWTLWAVMYDLASTACILFAVSGVVIWAGQRERDKISWLMLILGVGFTLSMILYLMLTR